MTSGADPSEAPDGRHGWFWGCTAAALVSLGFPVSVGVAAILAGLFVLVPPREHRHDVIYSMIAGAAVVGFVVPLLLLRTLDVIEGYGDAVMLAVLAIGFVSGLVSGISGRAVTLPGLHAFRLFFLELCVMTGLLGGFFMLPKLHLTGAADAGGRITFAAALTFLFLILPAAVGHFLGRGLRRMTTRTAA